MSRPLRILAPGLTYHVYSRGNGRMRIYLDDRDREQFLDLLAKVVRDFRVTCHAFCEMDDHYHLVATTADPNLSRAMRQLNGEYAGWWNDRHAHVGHVLHGRFGAKIVQEDRYLLTACAYVVRNPVRKGMVASVDQWRWSSYRATAGLDRVPSFLDPHLIWRMLGGSDRDSTTRRYRELVALSRDDRTIMDRPILGDDDFVARFAEFRRRASREVPLRERRARPPLDAMFAGVLTRAARNLRAGEARAAGYSTSDIARFLDLTRSTVRKMIQASRGQVGKNDQLQT